tara:strand:+ start:27742 stop:28023 length:282 start_codon:yes stop_codon:yes gene_type:complete
VEIWPTNGTIREHFELRPGCERRLALRERARLAQITGAGVILLAVVGHHKQGFWSHWISRSVAAGLGDALGCSLLLARKVVEDSELFAKGEEV